MTYTSIIGVSEENTEDARPEYVVFDPDGGLLVAPF